MFNKYSKLISQMTSFEKEDILNKKFELYSENNMKIFYAPHNEIINKEAKIFIVGITPGWTQTSIAYETAYNGLKQNLSNEEIKKVCKKNSRFAGSMRKNLIQMLDELNLNEKLLIKSCESLFKEDDNLLHTTSIIPYPVFIKEKNYTGHTPKILESEVLMKYVEKYFYKEIKILQNILIIPLGNSVEEVLKMMVKNGLISDKQCLFGFPHPSGANGHRIKQFENNKDDLKQIIENYFEK